MALGLALGLPYQAGAGARNSRALVVILLGQSLNVSRGTKVEESSWDQAYMPVDAVAVSEFDFFATNNEHTMNWTSIASAVPLAEGTGQSPCVGIAAALADNGNFGRAYFCSVAVGARALGVLMSGGPRCNLYAALYRLCDLARADGFDPHVVFYSAHGEADATANTGEATYYSRGLDYYRMAQLAARQAMGKPDYVAPVFLTYPAQQKEGQKDCDIKEAIRRIGEDLEGAVIVGPVYQWPMNGDLVHPTEASYVKRGEAVGRAIKQHVDRASDTAPLTILSVTLDSDTFVATFSAPVVQDDSLGVGASLNTANALDGFEWLDNGSYIQITSLEYDGATVTGTLASVPVGTIGQQVLRIAEQANTPTATVPDHIAGSYVRKDEAGWLSIADPTYTNYGWACPQSCDVSAA